MFGMRDLLKELLPPVLLRWLRRFDPYGFTGEYASFAEALASGVDRGGLFTAPEVARSLVELEKQDGPPDARLEEHELRLLAALEHAFIRRRHADRFHVVDFGGGSGTHHQRLRRYLPTNVAVSWIVCETRALCALAVATAELRFHGTERPEELDALQADGAPDCVLASGSLQCVPEPAAYFARLEALGARVVVLDRVPFTARAADFCSIQTAPPWVHAGRFPAWFLAERPWLERLARVHTVALRWRAPRDTALVAGMYVEYQGCLLERVGDATNASPAPPP